MNLDHLQGVEKRVCQDIAARQKLGIKKYGQTVAEAGLTHEQWLQHAYLEALDHAVYLKAAIEELQTLPDRITKDLFRDGDVKQAIKLQLIGDHGENLGGLSYTNVLRRLRNLINRP